MAGRRLRETIRKTVNEISIHRNTKVVIAGLSNIYTHYITTFEEYQKQRYEGASTIYGPHTLLAYQQQYQMLAEKLERNEIMEEKGPNPPDLYSKQMSFLTGVVYDDKPLLKKFGDCLLQPPSIVHRGFDTVVVEFQSGHPRNNLRTGKSFIYIEKAQKGDWEVIAVDSDWDTKWQWIRIKFFIGQSKLRVSWKVPLDAKPGVYRIRHVGSYKHGLKMCHKKCIFEYEGHTRLFEVK
jgi:neutral ceramidase